MGSRSTRWERRRGPPPSGRALSGAHAPGSCLPTPPALQPRLTRSGALHAAGASGRRVWTRSGGGCPAQRPGAGREAEAEAGAGPGADEQRAGAGAAADAWGSVRGGWAGVGPEPQEPQSPLKLHAQAGRPEPAEGAAPMRGWDPDSGRAKERKGVGSRDPGAAESEGASQPHDCQAPPPLWSGAAPCGLWLPSVISRGSAFAVPCLEGGDGAPAESMSSPRAPGDPCV